MTARFKDNPLYHQPAWKRARLAQLRKAKWRCELRLEGCQGAASEVDHIHGIAADPEHRFLRAACTSCHRKRTAQQGNDAKRGRPKNDPEPTSRITWD